MSDLLVVSYAHIALEVWGAIFCLIASFCIRISRNFNMERRLWMMRMQQMAALLLVMDAFAWMFRGNESSAGYYIVRVSNYAVFVVLYMILLIYVGYCRMLFTREARRRTRIRYALVFIICMMGITLTTISQFNGMLYSFDETNRYHRGRLFPLVLWLGITGFILFFTMIFQFRRELGKDFLPLASYIVLPVAATVAQRFLYGIELINIAVAISSISIFILSLRDQAEMLVEKEKQVGNMQIQLAVSQIGPHFLYNALTSIKELCGDNRDAKKAIDNFAIYLRGNIDAMQEEDLIPFEAEKRHVEAYLEVEKLRFEDRVLWEWDADVSDVFLPALTLQPIVENAVKHGITKKPGGGKISISARDDGMNCIITVSDNGVGYDTSNPVQPDGGSHIGIQNVKKRLSLICGGTLEIESEQGEGTVVTIKIPQE